MAPLIRVIGSLNADLVSVVHRFPEPGETITTNSFTSSAGGKGANQAVACSRLSRSRLPSCSTSADTVLVQMVGAVGGRDVHFQAVLKPALEESCVDISRVRVKEEDQTGVSVIVVTSSADGENRIFFSPGANYSGMQATPDVIHEALAAPLPDIIVMQGETPMETLIAILRDVKRFKASNIANGERGINAGPEIVFNPAPAPPGGLPQDVFDGMDHLIMNETEAELMAPTPEQLRRAVPNVEGSGPHEKVAQYYHKLGVTFVVVTLGSKGAWYSASCPDASSDTANASIFTNHVQPYKVEKVEDTTAAGDTFVGAYATYMARWRETRRRQQKDSMALHEADCTRRNQQVMDEAIQWASKAAARCVERQGAMASIPWEDEI